MFISKFERGVAQLVERSVLRKQGSTREVVGSSPSAPAKLQVILSRMATTSRYLIVKLSS